ncbi:hypothetical protein L1987_15731 [Smallanthus sonchifolius]|uniref:Uncharacterized protein n=1 Tax=Smallanthus sonchifolius TaxID=185202 RepID=A0ACB9J8L4_9ASTR|nr:hypothetical protein L1987_15731 [Smallanthus sonchifolius]
MKNYRITNLVKPYGGRPPLIYVDQKEHRRRGGAILLMVIEIDRCGIALIATGQTGDKATTLLRAKV